MAGSSFPLSLDQLAIVLLLVGLIAVFALDRFRIELVALGGLAAGYALGLVPAADVFAGFASPAVITVAEILLIVQALGRSRVLDYLSARLLTGIRGETAALGLLCVAGAVLSTVMNNIGALALMLPIAVGLGGRLGLPLDRLLMPLSFATLLGGLCSLIGTPANLVVSHARDQLLGQPFSLFDLAPAGLPIAAVGVLLIVLWAPRALGKGQDHDSAAGGADRRLVTELLLPAASPLAGATRAEVADRLEARIFTVLREGRRLFGHPSNQRLEAGDLLVCELPFGRLEAERGSGAVEWPAELERPDQETAELAVAPQSVFVGSRVGALAALASRDIEVLGVVPQRPRLEGRLGDLQLAIGDLLIVRGEATAIAEAAEDAGLLTLSAGRSPQPGQRSWRPLAAFVAGLLVAGFGLAPPEISFGLVVLLLAATGSLGLRSGLQELNWPVLIMLAAMIPLGAAFEATGAARALSFGLLQILPSGAPLVLAAALMLLAVLLTPFLNNVSTAIVLSPLAVEIALAAHVPADPLLIAVALGASLDFLTPFGHHNNTLVMGMAGYRFVDFPKLGAPLLLVSFAVGLAALQAFWL